MQTSIRNCYFAFIALLTTTALAQQSAPVDPPSQNLADSPTEDVVPAIELEQALQELESTHAQNYNTLAKLAETVPDSARPAIQQAMENSRRGWERARQNRGRALAKRQAKMQARQGRGQSGKPSWAGNGGRQTQSNRESDTRGQFAGPSSERTTSRQPQFGQRGQAPSGQQGQAGGQRGQQRIAERPSGSYQPSQATQGGQPSLDGSKGKSRGKFRR